MHHQNTVKSRQQFYVAPLNNLILFTNVSAKCFQLEKAPYETLEIQVAPCKYYPQKTRKDERELISTYVPNVD